MSTLLKTTFIPTTVARRRLFELVKKVSSPASIYTLTDRGQPKAILMSVAEYESWLETLAVRHDFPDLIKVSEETTKAVQSGVWKKWPTLAKLKKDYGLHSSNQTKR